LTWPSGEAAASRPAEPLWTGERPPDSFRVNLPVSTAGKQDAQGGEWGIGINGLSGSPVRCLTVSPAVEGGREDDPTAHIDKLLKDRAAWYRAGCQGLEDVDDYFVSRDIAKDAAGDLESACVLIADLRAVLHGRATPQQQGTKPALSPISQCRKCGEFLNHGHECATPPPAPHEEP
jgi:hypothetical protein